MTDTQILTLIIGITFPVLGLIGAIVAVLYSNQRMDDFRDGIGEAPGRVQGGHDPAHRPRL